MAGEEQLMGFMQRLTLVLVGSRDAQKQQKQRQSASTHSCGGISALFQIVFKDKSSRRESVSAGLCSGTCMPCVR